MNDRFADHNDPASWGDPADWTGGHEHDHGAGADEPRPLNVAGPWGIRVLSQQCTTCVFRPGNPMHLEPGQLKDLVEDTLEADTAIICHATLDLPEQAVCRGFADAYDTTPLQVARRLGKLVEVDPPPTEPGTTT